MMRRPTLLLLIPTLLLLASCASKKGITSATITSPTERATMDSLLSSARPDASCLSAKIKLQLSASGQEGDLSVGGHLKMKRGKVVRLQLVALGIMEAGRLEFTPDYVLLMDRINKQYVKADYNQLDFLRDNGLSFASLEALFWGEPFAQDGDYTFNGDTATISLSSKKMDYEWKASTSDGSLYSTNITCKGDGIKWNYGAPKAFAGGLMPSAHDVALTIAGRSARMKISLKDLSTDDSWEELTQVSSKYKEVDANYLLRRLLSL